MRCTACGHENRDGAKFCEECAVQLKRLCASCGVELRPTAKFCDQCGAQLQGSGPRAQGSGAISVNLTTNNLTTSNLADTRKIVSILFADLAGSTALHERLDPESVRAFMARYYEAMRAAVAAHDGTVVKLLGDGVMVAFGVPRVAEDDAIRAVRAAVAMQESFRALAGEQGDIGLRVAVNTGEVVVSAGDSDVLGDPVNVAARLQQEAGNGEVVIGEATQRLVGAQVTLEPLGRFALKGRAEAVKAYRVASLERPAGAAAVAFVGRDEELRRITAVYEEAIARPAARLAVLAGSPGLGKSRLIDELGRRLGDGASVLMAQCDAAGGATFAPIAEALREWLSAGQSGTSDLSDLRAAIEAQLSGTDAERARTAAGITALLAGSPASPEETFFVVRRFLAGLAASKPVVLVIDDLQWAEPFLLDLVEHLVQWGRDVPLLVLVGARPELRDVRSSLMASGGLVADVVTLTGLDAGAAMRLAANVIGAADLPAAVAAKVLATSEGNPLFVAELVRMLVQEGGLTKEGERWTIGAKLDTLEMPPTIHALLAARIERLHSQECFVLERAAVVGRHFSRAAVAALLPDEAGDLDALLEALRRSELIEPDTGWLLGEPVLRFHHVLIRDAAYRRLLKGTRADLHRRLADWIEARSPDTIEHDETIGRHLEQAHQLLSELGPIDAEGRALGERASLHLAAAGRRALARDDLPLAAGLLGRAIARLDSEDPGRADLALDWCEALLAAGDVGSAAMAIGELERHVHPSEEAVGRLAVTRLGDPPSAPVSAPLTASRLTANRRLSAWHTCFVGQLTVLTAPRELQATSDAVAAAAEEFEQLGDAAGEAKAHFVHALALARLGKVGDCEAVLDQALAAARKAGDRRRANTVLAIAPLAALWGPSPVTRASGRCLDVVRVLRITQGAPAVEAVALSCQGVLEALRGRTTAARRMVASSRKLVEELGITHRLLEADAFAGLIDLLEGNAAAAERNLRGAYEGLRDLGLGIDAARAASLLARALLPQDRIDEAEALSHESEALAGDDLKAAIAWRGVRAEALARRGEHSAAVGAAKAGVEIAAATDALLDHADARLALAAALRAAGHDTEAAAEERHAIELWEAKGATLLAERARVRSAGSGLEGSGARADVGRDAASLGAQPEREPRTLNLEPREAHRRVRPNAASRLMLGIEAGFAARDRKAIEALLSDELRTVEHPTGAMYEREGQIESIEQMLRLPHFEFRLEVLATLGEALCLGRRRVTATGTAGGRFDVAAYEMDHIVLNEADGRGRLRLSEVFAADHLGDARARLFERYAELLPEGPARDCAATTARSIAAIADPSLDLDALGGTMAPDFEQVDHRSLSTWSATGAAAALEHYRALRAVAHDTVFRTDDVLAMQPDAFLEQRTHTGTDQQSGGRYERAFLILFIAAPDGRLAHLEFFDADRELEALARFDELTATHREGEARAEPGVGRSGSAGALRPSSGQVSPSQSSAPVRAVRRVRPNIATRSLERFKAVLNARDRDALSQLFDESLHVVHDPSGGATYGRREMVGTWRSAMKAGRFDFRQELLASLGDTLALERHVVVVEELSESDLKGVGRAEFNEVALVQADDRGRWVHVEIFAAEQLRKALGRFYERYAELLPDGPERVRAAATARSVAVWSGPIDPDLLATALIPSFECVDHRILGTWSARGAQEFLEHWRWQNTLVADFALRDDEVLALTPEAFLVRRTYFGSARDSGGGFENLVLLLYAFGADGLLTRAEVWEPGHETEALVRFDALVGGAVERSAAPRSTRSFPNAATRLKLNADGLVTRNDVYDPEQHEEALARFAEIEAGTAAETRFANAAWKTLELGEASWRARDWGTLELRLSPRFRYSDRRPLMQLELDRDEWMAFLRPLGEMASTRVTSELLATRGERLALVRSYLDVAGGDVGPSETHHLNLYEIDEHSHLVALVRWEADDIDAAYAELDARFEAGEAATPSNNWLSIAGFVRAVERRDWDAVRALCREDFVEHDHRGLAVLGGTEGADAWVDNFRLLVELAPDTVYRAHHVLEAERGYFVHGSWYGTREGGPYELQVNAVLELDGEGRFRRADMYDDAVADAALARLAELGTDRPPLLRGDHGGGDEPPPSPLLGKEGESREQRFANAATRAVDRGTAALAARDWKAFAGLMAPGFRHYDRTRIAQLETDGREWLASTRRIVEMTSAPPAYQVLATRGERLALFEMLWRGAKGDVGPSEIEQRLIVEANERGEHVAIVVYDPEDLDAAYAELDARFEAQQGDRLPASWTVLRRWIRAVADRDWEAVALLCADDFVEHDHRSLSLLGVTRGVEPWVQVLRTVSDLAPDSVFRIHHFIPGARGYYEQGGFYGTREGRPFEIVINALVEIDDRGLLARVDLYDDDRVYATSRWSELGIPVPSTARGSAALDAAGPTVAEPNAASLWPNRFRLPFNARDWDAVHALFAPEATYEDRQRRSLLSGDLDMLLSSVHARAEAGFLVERVELLGTAGRRVAIQRILWVGGGDKDRVEVEVIVVQEVDDAGRLRASITFDADEARAAQREAWARWVAIEPDVAAVVRPVGEVLDAFNEKSAAKWRAAFADDLVVEDHRLAGMGRIDGADAYTESIVALWKLAPVTHADLGWRWPALDHRGAITVVRRMGSVPDGGGDFENEYLYLYLVAQGRITRVELFEMHALDKALARFEELCGARNVDGLATGAIEHLRGWNEHDLVRARGGLCDDLVLEDHRRTGMGRLEGADAYIASVAAIQELIPDAREEILHMPAVAAHGCVTVMRRAGANAEGGAVESLYVLVALYREDKVARFEVFELEQLDAALARFEELAKPKP